MKGQGLKCIRDKILDTFCAEILRIYCYPSNFFHFYLIYIGKYLWKYFFSISKSESLNFSIIEWSFGKFSIISKKVVFYNQTWYIQLIKAQNCSWHPNNSQRSKRDFSARKFWENGLFRQIWVPLMLSFCGFEVP